MAVAATSYYAHSSVPTRDRPGLASEVAADVCVIGGGIAGCSTALHLAERGYRVVLLEAQRIGSGASGRSGGQAITGYACGQHKLEQQVGFENARRMWDISVEGLQLIRDRVARHAIDCDLHWGQLHVAIKERQREDLLAEQRDLEQSLRLSAAAIHGAPRGGVGARHEAILRRDSTTPVAGTFIR